MSAMSSRVWGETEYGMELRLSTEWSRDWVRVEVKTESKLSRVCMRVWHKNEWVLDLCKNENISGSLKQKLS